MSKLPFRREIVRGVVLGVLLLSAMLLGLAVYHSATTQKAAAAPSAVPAVEVTPSVPAAAIETPKAKLSAHDVPPPPPLGKQSRSGKQARADNAGAPKAPVSAAIHEEEAAPPSPPPSPEGSAAPADEKTAAPAVQLDVPQELSEPSVEDAKPNPENRGVRWIKSLGRRLRIGGK